MKYIWKLQDAKSKFSQVVEDALKKGPQFVTRRGKETAVILSSEEYRKLKGEKVDFKDFLLNTPSTKRGLHIERDKTTNRDIKL